MIDCIRTKSILPPGRIPPTIQSGEKAPFEWQGLEFMPTVDNTYRATKESLQAVGLGNLHAVFRNGTAATFHLSNSLHKVAHNGFNHTDFTFSEIGQTVERISDTLGFDFGKADLTGKFEFGVNLETDEPENYYLPDQTYRYHKPAPMLSKGKQYGSQFCLPSYNVKIYSPIGKIALQGKEKPLLDRELIRFEIVTSSSYLRQRKVNLHKVKDLMDKRNLQPLGKILTDTAKQIRIIPLPPNGLDLQQSEIWHFFNNATPAELKHCRKTQKQTFYRHKAKFEEMLKQCRGNGEYSMKVAAKWAELLAA
jgi:hypothetical protein